MPPGRPRSFDTDAAIENALELFWRRGVRGTSTRDLEARLGVRQASLYAAFGSKADLAGLAMDRYIARIDATPAPTPPVRLACGTACRPGPPCIAGRPAQRCAAGCWW